MKNIQFNVTEIMQNENLYELNNSINYYMELVPFAVNKSYKNLWDNRQDYVQAGVPNDSIALYYNISFQTEKIESKDLARVITGFFEDEFKEDNVLSVRMKKEGFKYQFFAFIFPLKGRILDTSFWIEEEESKVEVLQYFYRKIEECLNISLDKSVLKHIAKDKTQLSVAEIDRFDELSIPEMSKENIELIYDAKGNSFQVQSTIIYEKLEQIINNTLKYFTVGTERMLFKQAQLGQKTPKEFMEQVLDYLSRNHSLDENDTNIVCDKIYGAVFGNYVLDDLINDESISDIKVLAPDKIRVKVNGQRMTSNMHFIDAEDYQRFIDTLEIRNNLDLKYNAIVPFTDKYTNPNFILRFNICTPYVNSSPYPYLHIRKVRKNKYSVQDLIRLQVMDKKIADYLVYKARNGRGIVFTGKGASGKTTVMNTLIDEVPYTNSGLVIQESEELFSDKHPDFMFQHLVSTGPIQYSLQDEARNGLLTDLDYFIIGEIKGAEALYFLNAADTGHKCWCSVHSPSSVDAINKLADYVMYESKYDKKDALYMLKELDTVVFMKNFKVYEISEVVGWDKEKKDLIYKTIYKR